MLLFILETVNIKVCNFFKLSVGAKYVQRLSGLNPVIVGIWKPALNQVRSVRRPIVKSWTSVQKLGRDLDNLRTIFLNQAL